MRHHHVLYPMVPSSFTQNRRLETIHPAWLCRLRANGRYAGRLPLVDGSRL